MRLPEFPPIAAPSAPLPETPEAICAALAPSIQTEEEMTALLAKVEPDKREAIEMYLRQCGACRSVAGSA